MHRTRSWLLQCYSQQLLFLGQKWEKGDVAYNSLTSNLALSNINHAGRSSLIFSSVDLKWSLLGLFCQLIDRVPGLKVCCCCCTKPWVWVQRCPKVPTDPKCLWMFETCKTRISETETVLLFDFVRVSCIDMEGSNTVFDRVILEKMKQVEGAKEQENMRNKLNFMPLITYAFSLMLYIFKYINI